jgi:hypothetical protein
MSTLFTLPHVIPVDSSGQPYAAAKLYFFAAGTLNYQAVYADIDLTTPHAHPVVADRNGKFAAIYLDPEEDADYRVQLKTSAGVLIYDQDDIPKDGMNFGLIQAAGTGTYVGDVSGTADAIELAPNPAIAAYAAGQTFRFVSAGANTTAVTVSINGLSAKNVTKNGNTALVANDIPAGGVVCITYDGTQFQLTPYYTATVGDARYLKQGLETIYVPASIMTPATTNGAAAGTVETSSNKVVYKTLDFDTTTQEFAAFTVAFPKAYNNGTVTFQPIWTFASSSGGVVWALQGLACSDDDASDTAYGTEQTSTDTALTAGDVHVGATSSAITIAGTPASSDIVFFRVKRVPGDASDTLGADAQLIGIRLFYTKNAADDT